MNGPVLSSSSQEAATQGPSRGTLTTSDLIDRLGRSERVTMGALSLALFGLLAVGTWLSPSPEGMGTHQQLGLPPCTMLFLLGIRCPGCGMTTSWAYMLEGQLVKSFQTNSAGALLCLLALWAAPITAWLAYRGKPTRTGWFSRYSAYGLLIALSVAVVDWIYRLTQ